jgi:hypothetical protein
MDLRGSVRDWARAVFTIDLRSLALLRIVLATLVLVDLASRARLLQTNYTDVGAHPRSAVLAYREPGALPSLHLLSGSAEVQAALFCVAALVALALALGWHTRLATLLTWGLAISLQARHELLLDGGDHALRHLLFWCLFLPLGAYGSFDARRKGPPAASSVFSPASAALLLQGASLFLVTGLVKTGPEWTTDMTAIRYAISREWWILPFGEWLLAHPFLPELLTPAVRWWEIGGPLLLFVPVAMLPLRLIGVGGLWGMLGGLGLGLKLNLFPFIAGSGLIAFLPGALWERLGVRIATAPAAAPRREPPPLRRAAARGGQGALVALLLLLVVWMNLRTVDRVLGPPEPLERFATWLQMRQGWKMYAPSPRHVDVVFTHQGRLANGADIDLDRATLGPAWDEVRSAWQDYRFLYFLQRLYGPRWQGPLDAYALWLCRRWNADARGGGRLESVQVASVAREIVLGDAPAPPPEKLTRATALCPR